MKGTNIYYISGPGSRETFPDGIVEVYELVPSANKAAGVGSPKYYTGVSADDTPITDYALNLGWHDYWDKQTYVDWFNANIIAYGVSTAIAKMKAAVQSWGSVDVGELEYGCDPSWLNYFISQGMQATDVATPQCIALANSQSTFSNLSSSVTNLSSALQGGTGIIKILLPLAVIGGGIYLAKKFL